MAAFTPRGRLAHVSKVPDPCNAHGQRFSIPPLLTTTCAVLRCSQGS